MCTRDMDGQSYVDVEGHGASHIHLQEVFVIVVTQLCCRNIPRLQPPPARVARQVQPSVLSVLCS